jgi:outer membrane protein OmpA-like peptidoglycan-associated protein
MRERKRFIPSPVVCLLLLVLSLSGTAFSVDSTKIQGVIKGRSGATLIVQTPDSPRLVVVLTDSTKVSQIQGVLKARRKGMSMAALVPGLIVQAEGTLNVDNQLVASSVKFKGDDLQQAQAIQGGLHETQVRTEEHQKELAKQNAALEAQDEALKKQQEQLSEEQKRVTANKAAIDAAVARFGQLDDYYIFEEVTVYFGNGKTNIEAEYQSKLMQLAEKARTVQGYMVQVIGYASSTGSEELNQKLSEDRAHNVTIFLSQRGHIPLMNMLAPGAMGESRQVGNSSSAEGQGENRRVVVRVLQNKGIAGSSGRTR